MSGEPEAADGVEICSPPVAVEEEVAPRRRIDATRRPETDGDVEQESARGARPDFLPPVAAREEVESPAALLAKMAEVDAYLAECSRYDAVVAPPGDRCETQPAPAADCFWRDGEEVSLNDGEGGYSADYRVRGVVRDVLYTLRRISDASVTTSPATKALKGAVLALRYDLRELDAAAEKSHARLAAVVKRLLLAVDTSRGGRRSVVNQLMPTTCRVAASTLRRLCTFSGFGDVRYGFLDCRINVPIKFIFLGNMEKKNYGEGEGAQLTIDTCRHFGSYFEECLESVYDICFEMLAREVDAYRRRKVVRDVQYAAAVAKLRSAGDQVSLIELKSSRGGPSFSSLDEFFDKPWFLKRRDNVNVLGTAGAVNHETRLRYVRYDDAGRTVVEDEPEEGVDAIFVSSYVRFRIKEDGVLHMDVFARHALRVDNAPGEDEVEGRPG